MFDLHILGWHSFQQLCLTISREVFGQTVESYLETADAGQDGAFTGVWSPAPGETLSGRFVIQAKFSGKRDANLNPAQLADEIKKAEKLVRSGRCSIYILLTNSGLSGSANEKLAALFKRVGVEHFRAYGYTWICDQIRERSRLRMLVPRLYGLGDLSQILDERAYRQAQVLLDSMREDLAKVVLTDSYRKAAEALESHGFVLLIGEPAAGKTTIASMLSVAALDQWGASTMKLEDAKAVVQHWNPDEPTQFFWIDDAFGVTQYEAPLASQWNHVAPQVNAMVRKGAKIVMTSRDYIYSRARHTLKLSAFPLLEESKVVVNVQELSLEEKRQMLYNHIKLGSQPRAFKRQLKPYLEEIATNDRFIPEVARRFGNPAFTKDLTINRDDLIWFVEEQEEFLSEVLNGLDDNSKAALVLIFMRNGILQSPIELTGSERTAMERVGGDLASCLKAFDATNGSLVRYLQAGAAAHWTFKHPTIGDALSELLLNNPELLSIYVTGASVEKLLGQVTCGDVKLERAVIIPNVLFPVVTDRLAEFSVSAPEYSTRSDFYSFLTHRCSREFLSLFVDRCPTILGQVAQPGCMLEAYPEVQLAIKLTKLGLFPESDRSTFVEVVSGYAEDGYDLAVLSSQALRSVFTSAEMEHLRARLRSTLVPNLDNVRSDLQSNRDQDTDPADHVRALIDGLAALQIEFAEDPHIVAEAKRQVALIEEWVAEERSDNSDEDPRTLSELVDARGGEIHRTDSQGRTIFDDIDE